jgi:hypothetical protein
VKNKNMSKEESEITKGEFADSFSDVVGGLPSEIQANPETQNNEPVLGQVEFKVITSTPLEIQKGETAKENEKTAKENEKTAEKKNLEGTMTIGQIQQQLDENIENARRIFSVEKSIPAYFEFLENETNPLLQQYLEKNPEATKSLLERLKPETKDKDGKNIPLIDQLWSRKNLLDKNSPFEMGVFAYLDFAIKIRRYKDFARKNKDLEGEMKKDIENNENIFDGVHERYYYGQYLASCKDQEEIDRLRKEQQEVDAFRTQMTGRKVESDNNATQMFAAIERTMVQSHQTPEQIQKVQETISVLGTPTSQPTYEDGKVVFRLSDIRTQQTYTIYVAADGKILLEDIATKEKIELIKPSKEEAVDKQDAVFKRALIYKAFSQVDVNMDEFKKLFPAGNIEKIQSFYQALKSNPAIEPEMALWLLCNYYKRAMQNEFAKIEKLASLELNNNNDKRIVGMTDFLLRLGIVSVSTDKSSRTSADSSQYAFNMVMLESFVQSLSRGDPKENLYAFLTQRGIGKQEVKGKEAIPQDQKTSLPPQANVASSQTKIVPTPVTENRG